MSTALCTCEGLWFGVDCSQVSDWHRLCTVLVWSPAACMGWLGSVVDETHLLTCTVLHAWAASMSRIYVLPLVS